jgi:hypothetical protein
VSEQQKRADPTQFELDRKTWFSEEKRQEISANLVKALKEPVCELCGGKIWGIGAAPVSPMIMGLDRPNLSANTMMGYSYIGIWLSCENCENSKILQADKLGIDLYSEPQK